MIQQSKVGLDSRSEANPYTDYGMLPLITAPMYSVADDTNYQVFLDNKINVCLPRNPEGVVVSTQHFSAVSLDTFIKMTDDSDEYEFVKEGLKNLPEGESYKLCIDVANGNMPKLHQAIRDAKAIHGDNLTIMAGNVSSVQAFTQLAKAGCDYIRVGIGGSSVCNTTTQTGVGQVNLELLIRQCNWVLNHKSYMNVKIVADGITTYMNQLIDQKQGLDNGYAAINRLLYAGADIVMIGRLFAQSMESAGEKENTKEIYEEMGQYDEAATLYDMYVDYYGMSTKRAQEQYKQQSLKHSEGNSQWIPVKWTLDEWINGEEGDDYLIGYVNALRSAMSYTGSKTLKEFKQN